MLIYLNLKNFKPGRVLGLLRGGFTITCRPSLALLRGPFIIEFRAEFSSIEGTINNHELTLTYHFKEIYKEIIIKNSKKVGYSGLR